MCHHRRIVMWWAAATFDGAIWSKRRRDGSTVREVGRAHGGVRGEGQLETVQVVVVAIVVVPDVRLLNAYDALRVGRFDVAIDPNAGVAPRRRQFARLHVVHPVGVQPGYSGGRF